MWKGHLWARLEVLLVLLSPLLFRGFVVISINSDTCEFIGFLLSVVFLFFSPQLVTFLMSEGWLLSWLNWFGVFIILVWWLNHPTFRLILIFHDLYIGLVKLNVVEHILSIHRLVLVQSRILWPFRGISVNLDMVDEFILAVDFPQTLPVIFKSIVFE